MNIKDEFKTSISTFDDKVFDIIKASGGLKGTQDGRVITDDLYPVGSKLRDTSSDLQFTNGKWILSGVFGTAEVIVPRSATSPIDVKYYFEFTGSLVRTTIKDLEAIGYTSITLDFGTYLGSCRVKSMIGQAFNIADVYKLWDNDKGQIEVSFNGTTVTISGESLNINRMHELSFLSTIIDFNTIKDVFKDSGLTFEYSRLS